MKSIANRNCPFCHMTPIQTRSTSPGWNSSTDPASRSVSSVQIGGLTEWLVQLCHCGVQWRVAGVASVAYSLVSLWHCGTVVSEALLPDWVREHQSFFGSVPPCWIFRVFPLSSQRSRESEWLSTRLRISCVSKVRGSPRHNKSFHKQLVTFN